MYENMLDKRDNENDFEYHKRLVYGKLKDKTLADYDYAELSEPVYGRQYTADETRKRMYGSLKTLELMDDTCVKSITSDDLLSELDTKRLDLQKEKQRFFDQRREFNKLVNEEGRWEHLTSMLAKSAENLSETVGLVFPDPEYTPVTGLSEAVLCLGDWHYGMVTDNLFNRYDTNICKSRVYALLDETLHKLAIHKCRKIHIVLLGDFIHGGVHISTRVASEELICDQLMQVSEILAQFILLLSKVVDEVVVYSTYGNHARMIPNKKDNIHFDNMERIIPWWLEQRIAAEESRVGKKLNITVHRDDDTREFIYFEIFGFTFCAVHGDLDTVKTAPKSLSTLFSKVYGKDLDYILLGDKHHEEAFEEMGIEALLCGSLCGTDEYANLKRLYSKPSQLLLIVDEVDGVDARYKLCPDFN